MVKRNGNNGNHGKKGRSGRKPKAITVLKRQLAEQGKEEAEYAFSLLCTFMRSDNCDAKFRAECAREVMNRVLGTPKQSMQHTGPEGEALKIIVEYASSQAGVAGSSSGPEADRQ